MDTHELSRRFAANLRRWRKLRGLTQDQLAARVSQLDPSKGSWHSGHVCRYEVQGQSPTLRTVAVLAAALEVDPAVLLA